VSNEGHLLLNNSVITHTQGLSNLGGIAVVQDSSITANIATARRFDGGGGIRNLSNGKLTLRNSIVSGNGAYSRGGGIYNDYTSSATLIDSVVSGNRITYFGDGGGILNRGTLLLIGTTVADNTAAFGGGIYNRGTATIRRSTISGNRVNYFYGLGGGITNFDGDVTLANSTVSHNQGPQYGGGVDSFRYGDSGGALVILNSTVTGNTSRGGGRGVAVHSGTLTVQRSIVSGNNQSTDETALSTRRSTLTPTST
jgi:hypothetical protein